MTPRTKPRISARCGLDVLAPTLELAPSPECLDSCPVSEVLALRERLAELTDDDAVAETIRASLEAVACSIATVVHETGDAREELLHSALGMTRAAVVTSSMAVVTARDLRRRNHQNRRRDS